MQSWPLDTSNKTECNLRISATRYRPCDCWMWIFHESKSLEFWTLTHFDAKNLAAQMWQCCILSAIVNRHF